MAEFKREEKYIVLKREDVEKYLTPEGKHQLAIICRSIHVCQEEVGKKDNRYIVVNQDEPYAEQVWNLIEKVKP